MTVFRTTEIKFNGDSYQLTPTMALLSSIERSGKSLMGIAAMAAKGQPQVVLIAEVMGSVLRSAGAPVTDDQLLQLAYDDNAVEFLTLWSTIFEVISPEPKEGKKPDAPDGK